MTIELALEQKTVERIEFIIQQNPSVSVSSIVNEAVKRLYETELKFINRQKFDKGEELFKEI